MKIERVKVSDLLTDPSNARTHSSKNLDAIKASFLKFGQQKPIVVNKDGVVIAGNGGLIAARELGWEHINAVRSELGKVEQTAYAIADNRTSDLSDWDRDVLGDTLQSLREDSWDLNDLGFDAAESLLFIGDDKNIVTNEDDEWSGLPDYEQYDPCHRRIVVSFEDDESVDDFFARIEQKFTDKTKSIWHPEKIREVNAHEWVPENDEA